MTPGLVAVEALPLALGWALVGWLLGLALNRVVYQLPRDHAVLSPPLCPSCEHAIPWLGRPPSRPCSHCGARTDYDRVDWAVAGLFALLALYHSPGAPLLVYSFYALVLVVIAAIDARHRYVYTIVSYPAVLLSVILSPLIPGLGLVSSLLGLALGSGAFLVFYLVGRLVYRGAEPMGTGDITIAALIGAMVGFPRVLPALVLGSMVSALIGILVMAVQRRGRRTFIPYGPGLCAGALAAFFMAPDLQ